MPDTCQIRARSGLYLSPFRAVVSVRNGWYWTLKAQVRRAYIAWVSASITIVGVKLVRTPYRPRSMKPGTGGFVEDVTSVVTKIHHRYLLR